MKPENRSMNPEPDFTETQSALLGALRARYQQDHDLFTGRELSHLRFMRWLQETHPATDDSSIRRHGPMLVEPDGRPVGVDCGGTSWCEL